MEQESKPEQEPKPDSQAKPVEYDFPIVDYYKGQILNGETINHAGNWWTAALLINDPRTRKPFIGLYRWQKTQSGWKTRKRFSFKRAAEVKHVIATLDKFSSGLD